MNVAVVFEPGGQGEAALAEASWLAGQSGSYPTVVVLAPQAPVAPRCGPAPSAYNEALRDAAFDELRQAAALIDCPAHFQMLVEGSDPPLGTWVAEHEFDLLLLPCRRRVLRGEGHPALRKLRAVLGERVRLASKR
jgi:hypothetical protein